MNPVAGWIKERLPVDAEKLKELTNEPVPNHLKLWWFCLGGTPAYLFIVQIVTGILLSFYYQPSAGTAWESVRYITEEAAFGWFLRSVHKWGATLMVAAVVLHQIRVFFTGAYRKPREINWMVGMFLLLCTLITGFTGYSLVYEQLSFWGATVASNLMDAVPVLGGILKQFLLAGDQVNPRTLPRFFVLHAAVLPTTMVLVIAIHIMIIRLQGVTEFHVPGETMVKKKHFNFFPDHFLMELLIGLVLMVLLCTLAVVFPATMGEKADPLSTPEVIKPEWYFYVAFRWLKLMPLAVAVLSQGFIVFVMLAWPLVDGWIRRRRPQSEASVWVGLAAVAAITALTVWEALVEH
jgi:quinol-cytochrome oxidoreductase complex cytochrome b subunit